jgi:hypothetical protein
LGVGPHAPRALVRGRRLDHGRLACRTIDPGDVITGERGVVDVACAGRRDAVRSPAAWGRPHFDLTRLRLEAAVDPILACEPEHAVAVERGRVQVGVGRARRQPPRFDRLSFRVDPNDRILPAVGQPRGPVWSLDDAVWRRTLAEGNVARAAGLRIEDAESPDLLGRVPDLAIRRRRDIVWVGILGESVDLTLRRLVLCWARER